MGKMPSVFTCLTYEEIVFQVVYNPSDWVKKSHLSNLNLSADKYPHFVNTFFDNINKQWVNIDLKIAII